jgi:phospholipase C
LTSVFRPYTGEPITQPKFLERQPFLEEIHQAQFKQMPTNYQKLDHAQIEQINARPAHSPHFPQQEKGTRAACALPYELYVDRLAGNTSQQLGLAFKAGNTVFGKQATGAPFRVYAIQPYQSEAMRAWDYSVAAGDTLQDEWMIHDFDADQYHLRVYGPNGFYREFKGSANNPRVGIECRYETQRLNRSKLTGNLQLTLYNRDKKAHTLTLLDNSYKANARTVTLPAGGKTSVSVELSKQHGWYDLSVRVKGYDDFSEQFAGHVETGAPSTTDPLMGRVV